MELWSTFAVVDGGVGGALLGLLFVAVSIRVDVIARSAELRNRAAQTMALFVITVLISIVFALPGQSELVVGIEFLLIALASAAAFIVLDHRAGRGAVKSGISRILDVSAPRTVCCVVLLIGAALVVAGFAAGFYVIAAGAVIAIVGGVISAWFFLTRVSD